MRKATLVVSTLLAVLLVVAAVPSWAHLHPVQSNSIDARLEALEQRVYGENPYNRLMEDPPALVEWPMINFAPKGTAIDVRSVANVIRLTEAIDGEGGTHEIAKVVVFPDPREDKAFNIGLYRGRMMTLVPYFDTTLPEGKWATEKEVKKFVDANKYPVGGGVLIKTAPKKSTR